MAVQAPFRFIQASENVWRQRHVCDLAYSERTCRSLSALDHIVYCSPTPLM